MWKRVLLFVVGAAVLAGVVMALRSPEPPPRVTTIEGSILAFPGATGWTDTACVDVTEGDLCLGQWRHESGQIARVLLLPLPDPSKLNTLSTRLAEQATASGGLAETIESSTGKVIRLLQPMRDADHGDRALLGITYVVTSPDLRSLHLLTSVVPLADEVAADGRVRDLLAFGVWVGDGDGPAAKAP
jgi:hypothetical protein